MRNNKQQQQSYSTGMLDYEIKSSLFFKRLHLTPDLLLYCSLPYNLIQESRISLPRDNCWIRVGSILGMSRGFLQ